VLNFYVHSDVSDKPEKRQPATELVSHTSTANHHHHHQQQQLRTKKAAYMPGVNRKSIRAATVGTVPDEGPAKRRNAVVGNNSHHL
jgi:hypothetical protein